MKLVIGTRGSKLARWQADWVKTRLEAAGHIVEIRVIKTAGDKMAGVPLAAPGTKGLFIKEIEEALLAREVDLAVHSMKDLPTELPQGLLIGAVPEREDPRDALISRDGKPLAELRRGARMGTSSLRRQSQLRALRPDLEISPLRGNVDTRLKKLDRGDYDGVVLAAAGLRRLGLEGRASQYFAVEEICPAVGQGALAVEIREDDADTAAAVEHLDHQPSHFAARAERAALAALGGGCQIPFAAYARIEAGRLRVIGVVASLEGDKLYRAEASGSADAPEALGASLARELLKCGARSVLAAT